MARFRKKPVVIEAIQFTREVESVQEILRFCEGHAQYRSISNGGDHNERLVIFTSEGELTASVNDWVIKGTAGEFYPCKPEIFAVIYEPEEQVAQTWLDGDARRNGG